MIGQIFKIHSDFFYVNTDNGVFECKLRDILKKAKYDVLVGDFVWLDNNPSDKSLNFISEILERKNSLLRPKVANVTQSIIVSAIKNPDINFEQLDRFIALSEYNRIKPVLCFNKCDLEDSDGVIDTIKEIYSPLGYDIYFISALLKDGINELFEILKGNISIFFGSSGVGKSSIVNLLSDSLNLRVQNVSYKNQRGIHTTRHCEIFSIAKDISVVDTPGFSNIKFDFILPNDVEKLFREFLNNEFECRYKNCLHINEAGCGVVSNTNFFAKSRRNSYEKFVDEAKNYKEKLKNSGNKTESAVKYNHGKNITKISEVRRTLSRKVQKQNISEEYDG